MSNALSDLVHRYQNDPCAKFDEILAQKTVQVSDAQAWYNAWNSGRVSWNDIPQQYRPAIRQLMAVPAQ